MWVEPPAPMRLPKLLEEIGEGMERIGILLVVESEGDPMKVIEPPPPREPVKKTPRPIGVV
jgi:hypothetical protein